ncbi:MAG: disulfide bond formation protein B [Betaproteobacteria bacterium]
MSTSPAASQNSTANAGWLLIFAAWLVATASMLGALFFGEIMHLSPCVLCWWQRICMFPLVVILPAGLFPLDLRVVRYVLPLAAGGWLFALFHMLLMAGVIPEDLKPCTRGIPCSEKVIEWFGFVTIPLLSLLAFSAVIAFLFMAHSRSKQ